MTIVKKPIDTTRVNVELSHENHSQELAGL